MKIAPAAVLAPAPAARLTSARFELSQRFYFEAAHTLRRDIETEGSLRVHGHTYDAEVTVSGEPDAATGMVVDLGRLRREIAHVREQLDHRLLDEVHGLGPATLENLCRFIAERMAVSVPELVAVMVERRASGDRCVMRPEPQSTGAASPDGRMDPGASPGASPG